MTPLAGMRVLVTGAASGIGAATARALVAADARVAAADLDAERAAAAVPGALALDGDVRDAAACARLAARAEEGLGGIDALVHAAGILRPPGGRPRPLAELEDAEYDAVVGTNLTGTFLMNRAVLPRMIERRAGQILNIASTSGHRGRPLDAIYSASKAGMIGLSESIAEETRPYGLRVQVLLPDAVDTPLWRQNGILPHAPPGSLPPERVAGTILLALSLPLTLTCENLLLYPLRAAGARPRRPRTDP